MYKKCQVNWVSMLICTLRYDTFCDLRAASNNLPIFFDSVLRNSCLPNFHFENRLFLQSSILLQLCKIIPLSSSFLLPSGPRNACCCKTDNSYDFLKICVFFCFAGSQDLRAPEERMLHSIHPSIVETLPETFPDLKHEFSKLVSFSKASLKP